MQLVKMFAVLAVLAGLGLVVAVSAPSVVGQERRGPELRVLTGRGAEIGVIVRDATAGVTIDEVRPDSPADKAGLKPSDVILDFDGERVRSARQFSRLVQETPAGRPVRATVMRDNTKQALEIAVPESRRADLFIDGDLRDRLGDLSDRLAPFNFNFDMPDLGSGRRLGLSVQPLSSQLSAYFGVQQGLLVTAVTDQSPASRAGLKAGDVITAINGERVATREDLQRGLRDATRDQVDLGMVRDKQERTVTVTVEGPRRRGRPVI